MVGGKDGRDRGRCAQGGARGGGGGWGGAGGGTLARGEQRRGLAATGDLGSRPRRGAPLGHRGGLERRPGAGAAPRRVRRSGPRGQPPLDGGWSAGGPPARQERPARRAGGGPPRGGRGGGGRRR